MLKQFLKALPRLAFFDFHNTSEVLGVSIGKRGVEKGLDCHDTLFLQ
jgi:hypothetical protein